MPRGIAPRLPEGCSKTIAEDLVERFPERWGKVAQNLVWERIAGDLLGVSRDGDGEPDRALVSTYKVVSLEGG